MEEYLRWFSGPPHTDPDTQRYPPSGCCGTLVVYQERYLILFGGGSPQSFTNDVYMFDFISQQWRRKTTVNSCIVAPRLSHSAVIYGDRMIVYGGHELHTPMVFDDVLELDLVHWRWTLRHRAPHSPDGPGARWLHSAQVVGDAMYVLMGTVEGDEEDSRVWVLDLRTWEWHARKELAIPSMSGCGSAVVADNIYLFGGYRLRETSRGAPLCVYSQCLFVYNTTRSHFRCIPGDMFTPSPRRRYTAAVVAHRGYVYVFGGDANNGNQLNYFKDVWRICVLPRARMRWEEMRIWGRCPAPRSGCAYAYIRSCLCIVGGELDAPGRYRQGRFSNGLFTLPLSSSTQLTLVEYTARWIGHGLLCRQPGEVWLPARGVCQLSLGAQRALEAFLYPRGDD